MQNSSERKSLYYRPEFSQRLEFFLTELSCEDLKVLSQFRSDETQNQALMPEILATLTIQELGLEDLDLEPSVWEDILLIVDKVVTKTLTFAATCANSACVSEL